jgi:ATP-dependent Clp protease ATP-binding subunit ClpA
MYKFSKTEMFQEILEQAEKEAEGVGHMLSVERLLLVLLRKEGHRAADFLMRLKVSIASLTRQLQTAVSNEAGSSRYGSKIIAIATKLATDRSEVLGTEHVLMAVLAKENLNSKAARILREANVTQARLDECLKENASRK